VCVCTPPIKRYEWESTALKSLLRIFFHPPPLRSLRTRRIAREFEKFRWLFPYLFPILLSIMQHSLWQERLNRLGRLREEVRDWDEEKNRFSCARYIYIGRRYIHIILYTFWSVVAMYGRWVIKTQRYSARFTVFPIFLLLYQFIMTSFHWTANEMICVGNARQANIILWSDHQMSSRHNTH